MTPEQLKLKIDEEQGMLVYFKNDFCGPCMALRPKVAELMENSFPEMELVIVDSFTNPSLAGQYNVFANPTLLVFFEGQEYIRKSKYISMQELQTEIERYYAMVYENK